MNTYTKAIPYFIAAMAGVAVTTWGTVLIQRELNAQAQRECTKDNYRSLVTFRGAAGDTSYCIPSYYTNGSQSLPD